MLKPLYSLFCRAKLKKLHYWWMCSSNAFSKSITGKLTQYSDKKIVSKNDDETVNSMDKLLDNIIVNIQKKVVKKKRNPMQKKMIMTPNIVELKMPETVLAVHVGTTMLSWTLLDCNYDVLDLNWRCLNNKADFYDSITLISAVIPTIPIAATYIIEDTYIPHKGSSIQRSLTQQQLGVSIMSCILLRDRLSSKSLESTNNIHVLQPYYSARWFNLMVGKEIISSEYVMKELLDASAQGNDKPRISINLELKSKYMKLSHINQDQASWSLLKALSFLRTIEARMNKK